MAEGFKTGDVVRLKSGGPTMTVSEIESTTGAVLCTWFDSTEKRSDSYFPASALKRVEGY